MEPLVIFVLQFLWFLFAWSLIAYFVLWPWSARLSPEARLSVWVAPEMFRVLGVGLLVPNLSPGMPMEFAASTAAGDSLTALLAASAFIGLAWSRLRRAIPTRASRRCSSTSIDSRRSTTAWAMRQATSC